MRKARVFRVRGKVSGTAQVAHGVRLMLLPKDRGMPWGPGASGIVRPDGTFEIESVLPGAYNLVATSAQGMANSMGRAVLQVGQRDVDDVVLTLSDSLSVQGTIRVEKAAGLSSLPKPNLASIRIQLIPSEWIPIGTSRASVKEDGSFSIENIGVDKYRLQVINVPPGTWLKSIRSGHTDILAGGLDMTSGAPGALEIVLKIGTGSVSGIVVNETKEPAVASAVTLVPDPAIEGRPDLTRLSATDAAGKFKMESLPPGDYQIFAWETIEFGNFTDPEFLKRHEGSGKRLTVKIDGSQQVSLSQIPASATELR